MRTLELNFRTYHQFLIICHELMNVIIFLRNKIMFWPFFSNTKLFKSSKWSFSISSSFQDIYQTDNHIFIFYKSTYTKICRSNTHKSNNLFCRILGKIVSSNILNKQYIYIGFVFMCPKRINEDISQDTTQKKLTSLQIVQPTIYL